MSAFWREKASAEESTLWSKRLRLQKRRRTGERKRWRACIRSEYNDGGRSRSANRDVRLGEMPDDERTTPHWRPCDRRASGERNSALPLVQLL
jgi:hypothetical protein